MSTFGVGIVGGGTIGAVHARALKRIEGAELVAIAGRPRGRGSALAKEHGADWHPKMESLLERPDVDAVILCTPSGLHPEGAVAAARAGKHVITEKPMAITLEGANRMIEACREAGVVLSVIFQYRYNRAALRLKRALDAGLFGRPVIGNALVHWRRTHDYYRENGGWRGTWELDGGGALMNQSIHAVDLLQWLLGPVESLVSYTATLTHDIDAEDTATAALRFGSGAMGVIQGTTSAHMDYPLRIEIRGEEGGATLEGSRLSEWRPSRDTEVLSAEELERFPDSPEDSLGPAHERQLREIFGALQRGEEPPLSGEEAKKAVEIVLGIYRSARAGERVQLSDSLVS